MDGDTASAETVEFLHRQNFALEAFRSRIAQELVSTVQRIDRRAEEGHGSSVDGDTLKAWLEAMYKAASRAYDREMRS